MNNNRVTALILFVLASTINVFASDGEKTAALFSKQYQSQFAQALTAFQSPTLILHEQSFSIHRDVWKNFSSDTGKVYLKITAKVNSVSDEEIKPAIRKNLYKLLNTLQGSIGSLINDDECMGVMIELGAVRQQASASAQDNSEEAVALCMTKYEIGRFLKGTLTLSELLKQESTRLIKNGKPISTSILL